MEKDKFSLVDLSSLLPTDVIYDNIWQISGYLTAISMTIMVSGIAVRWFQGALNPRGNIVAAFQNIATTPVLWGVYILMSTSLVALNRLLIDVYMGDGSFSLISGEVSRIYQQLVARSDPDWIQKVLDYSSVGLAGGSWLAFQTVSLVSSSAIALSQLFYALLFAFTYAWGFIAIPSRTWPDQFNSMGFFTKTVYGLFLWPIVEGIMFLMLKMVVVSKASMIASQYANTEVASYAQFSMLMTQASLAIIGIIFFAPAVTLAIVNNSSGVGAMEPAMREIMRTITSATKQGGGALGSKMSNSLPESGGDRARDKMADSLSQINQDPVGTAKSIKSKAADVFTRREDN